MQLDSDPWRRVGVLPLAPEQRLVAPSGELRRGPGFGDKRGEDQA